MGPLTARADLFADRTWVITPHDTSRAKAVLTVHALARACGARIVSMGATHHDEAVAQVSHLPQLMSSLAAAQLNDVPDEHLNLAGQGLRDVTRIAASDPRLWTQIISANTEAVRAELETVRDSLDKLLAGWGDPEALRQFLADGRQGTRADPRQARRRGSRLRHTEVVVTDSRRPRRAELVVRRHRESRRCQRRGRPHRARPGPRGRLPGRSGHQAGRQVAAGRHDRGRMDAASGRVAVGENRDAEPFPKTPW